MFRTPHILYRLSSQRHIILNRLDADTKHNKTLSMASRCCLGCNTAKQKQVVIKKLILHCSHLQSPINSHWKSIKT